MDMTGRVVFRENARNMGQGTHRKSLDINELESGVYLLRVDALNERFVSRIVKQ